jgi:hypothetical protein
MYQAVHDFSWGEAAAVLFLPSILAFLVYGLSFLIVHADGRAFHQ